MTQAAAIAFLQVMAVTTKRHANYKTPAECAYDLCECFNLYTSSVSNTQSNSDAVFGFVRPCSCPGITEAFLCGDKRLECKADNHPSSVENKNEWRFTSTPSCAFIACTRALHIIFLLCIDTFPHLSTAHLMSCHYMKWQILKFDFGHICPWISFSFVPFSFFFLFSFTIFFFYFLFLSYLQTFLSFLVTN